MDPVIVTVNMGYGHLRAAYPLREISSKDPIVLNEHPSMTRSDKRMWHNMRKFYEWISRAKSVPIIGPGMFWLYDRSQHVPVYDDFRIRTDANAQALALDRIIKAGFLRTSIGALNEETIIAPFYASAIAAAHQGIPVFCVVTDTDVNRVWVPADPSLPITYLLPCEQTRRRLASYGVPAEQLIVTGFPLPRRLIKDAHKNLARRLGVLDPNKVVSDARRQNRPVRIMFMLGGAGAQYEIGFRLIDMLAGHIRAGRVELIVNCGLHRGFSASYAMRAKRRGVRIESYSYGSHEEYFVACDTLLARTDVLITKPSEMCFYAGLGIPLLLTEPVGAHERANKRWVFEHGAGVEFFDLDRSFMRLLEEGVLASCALNGIENIGYGGLDAIARIMR